MDWGVEDDEVVAVPWIEGWEAEVEEEETGVEAGVEEVESVDGVEVAGELLLVVALCLIEAEEEE